MVKNDSSPEELSASLPAPSPAGAPKRRFRLSQARAAWPRFRLVAFGISLLVISWAVFSVLVGRYKPVERDVSERLVLYLEGLRPTGRLVLLSATDRYTASRDFTAKILSLLKIEASVEISAVADTSFCIDLSDTAHWRASYNPRTRHLSIKAPPPGILPPAVQTDTISVRTTGANLISSNIFSLKRETEKMRSELSADIAKREAKLAQNPEIRSRIASSLESVARSFCSSTLNFQPESVDVSFFEEP